WEGLGYYSRARSLKAAAGQIVRRYGGEIPRAREELLSLPGVGPYTAGAIAAFAFGLPEPAVDGNVMRVVSRLVACDRNVLDPAYKRDVEAWLRGVIPPDDASAFGQGLIELGALVCLPSPDRPRCEACPLAPLCRARAAGLTGILPVRYKTQRRRTEKKTVLLLTDGKEFLLRRRPATGLLADLWEFPNLEGHMTADEVRARFPDALSVEPLGESKHVFTHLTWEMTGYRVTLPSLDGREGATASREEIERVFAIPSAFAFYKKRL
ncbi:MAG: NUDIX domain-containing protein, partial [Clostridia bacterium]|nr:NUDIX domain-containing protein [Clostridia bacterium]